MKTTKEFTEKLDKEIEELGGDIGEIIRYLADHKFVLEEQIMDTKKEAKYRVDKYERELWDELNKKKSGLGEMDKDTCYAIYQLELEIGRNVESMMATEGVRLAELNKTRDDNIVVLCDMLEYYENL